MTFLLLIKNNAETTLLIVETFVLQKTSYTVQQISRKVTSPKTCIKNIVASFIMLCTEKITIFITNFVLVKEVLFNISMCSIIID